MRIQIQFQRPALLFFFCFLTLLLVVYLVPVFVLQDKYAVPKSSSVPDSIFSEERTYQLLEKIVEYGPRPLNTKRNRDVALFIVQYFETLRDSNPSSNPVKLVIDFDPFSQNSTVAWATEDSWSTFESTNIVIRIGTIETLNSDQPVILINSHYDSAYATVGAFDDGSGVSIMMELARNFLNSSPLKYQLVLLFNNGEEIWKLFKISPQYCCIGARAFYLSTTLKIGWALNIEGAGTSGGTVIRSNKFDLIKTYQNKSPYLHGTVFAEDVFDNFAKLLEADTDYGAVWDRNGIAGIDFAFIVNRYFYHTPNDNLTSFQNGSFQQMGEEIFFTVKGISDNKLTPDKDPNRVVFQDLGLGNSMIVNPIEVWQGLNLLLIIMIWSTFIGYFFYNYYYSLAREDVKKLLHAFGITITFVLLAFLFSLLYFSLFILISDFISPLRFYTNPPLFVATLIFLCFQGNSFIFWFFAFVSKRSQFPTLQTLSFRKLRNLLHVSLILFMTIINFVLTVTGFFGYFMLYFFFWILFPTLGFFCMITVEKFIKKKWDLTTQNDAIPSLQSLSTQTIGDSNDVVNDASNNETLRLTPTNQTPDIVNDENQLNQRNFVDIIGIGVYSLITFSFPWIMTCDFLWFQSTMTMATLGENGFFSILGGMIVYIGVFFPMFASTILLFHFKVFRFLSLSLFVPCVILWIALTSIPQFSPATPAKIDAYQYMVSDYGFLGPGAYTSHFMIRSKMLRRSQLFKVAFNAFPDADIDCEPDIFYFDDLDYDERCSVSLPQNASIPALPEITYERSFNDSSQITDILFRVEAQGSSVIRIEINSTLLSWSFNETQFSGEYNIVNIERINAWTSIDWTFSLQLQGEISPQYPIQIQTYVFYDEQDYGNYWKDFINSLEDSMTTFSSGTGLVRLKTFWVIDD